ncbi:MAG TPA: IS110 family transposase, partial [Candidatus Methylomirabilis sp.]|nr:IS110 family transposase [Candidatus Methylomirabilis sp.]
MWIIGCDFHPSWQQVAWLDRETGETGEAKLEHAKGEAERWYRQLPVGSLIGLEATGNCEWLVELLQKLGHEVWIGDAAKIRASYVRKQKNDRRDAEHLLRLLREGRFPRLWRPRAEQRDVRQLLIHRHKLVEMRARVKNALQHLAMNRGMQKKSRLWSQAGQKAFRQLALPGWAGCRRQDLLELLAYLDKKIAPLDRAAEELSQLDEVACLLRTQPGVGPITALAFAVTIGDASRFQRGKQVASYVGLIPREHSSGGKQRLGGISKQGNRFLRSLLVE